MMKTAEGNVFGKGREMPDIGKIIGGAAVLILTVFFCCACENEGPPLLRRETESLPDEAPAAAEPSSPSEKLAVHVCGAVQRPGVYYFAPGARRSDALEQAGGLTEDADESYINLALPLTDGEQLYFPTKQEAEALRRQAEEREAGLVNINTAGQSELETLPGIGPSLAGAILAYRAANGAFRTEEEIMLVPGIKQSLYAKLLGHITV